MRTTVLAAGTALLLGFGAMPATAQDVSGFTSACSRNVAPHHARCFAEYRTAPTPAGTGVGPAPKPTTTPSGLRPADIAAAYRLPTSKGAGQTIAVIDAYDNPNAESDLATYRKKFGLPACTTANHCFHKVNQRGAAKPLPKGDPDWAVETSLDLDAVSAACPKCDITLVESNSDDLTELGTAVNTGVRLGAKIVSNSYGATEFNGVSGYGKRYYTHRGVAIVASSGDSAFGPASFPAVWPRTTAIGGTTLTKKGTAWKETAWSGASSGCSAYIAKPSWQHDTHCRMRTVADVSAVADPDTGLSVYDTYGLGPQNGWQTVGGTSLAAPLIAGMIALAGNPAKLADAQYLYQHAGSFNDVVGGSNGSCGGDYLCTGLRGYDAPTGLGSPHGVGGL